MAEGKDNVGCVDALAVVQDDAGHAAIVLREPLDPGPKADLAAAGDKACAERFEQ